MSVELEEEVGGEDSNTYCTLEEANVWHNTQLNTDAWDDEGDDEKSKALIMATRLLDEQICWDGEPASETQALQWPRSGMLNAVGGEIGDDEIPQRLKDAEAELAKYLLAGDRTAELSSDGIKRVKAGSVEVEFRDIGPPERKVLPDAVWQMVALWGKKKFENTGVSELIRG